jgi:ferritin-like metal-binding protein YciE
VWWANKGLNALTRPSLKRKAIPSRLVGGWFTPFHSFFLMADKLETLDDLFEMQLKDLYSAETQLVTALPLMAENAKDGRLRAGFTKHLRETENQVQRLERIRQDLGIELGGHTCKAMAGLVAEGQELLSEDATEEVLDAALIAAAQRIEHYEIAGYGTAAHYAERLGHTQAADLLRQTLEEEQFTDTKLNDLAKNYINQKAE